MIKVHYTLGGGPFDDDPKLKSKTFTTKDPGASVEILEAGWVMVLDSQDGQLFAIQSHKVKYIEGKNESATKG